MNSEHRRPFEIGAVAKQLAIFFLFFLLAISLQKLGGVYESEFGSHPDEAAHYVTGLMVRDYIAAGFPGNPMTYAKNYYEHYPKVALGHWPPNFYLLQAGWTLLFTPSRISVLLFMACGASLLGSVLFSILKREFGLGKGLGGAILFLAIPLVQHSYSAVMTEAPVALMILVAALFFGRYLDDEKKSDSIAFGLLASLAILTKFSGFLLALFPVFGILLSRKYFLLKRMSFWWPAIIVIVLCGPWTLLTIKIASDGMVEGESGFAFFRKAAPFYFSKLFFAVGGTISLLAILGLVEQSSRKKRQPSQFSLAMGSLLVSVLVFQLLVPSGYEARHLVAALPAVVFFAIAGASVLARFFQERGLTARIATSLSFGIAVLAFVGGTFGIPQKGYQGFGPVAKLLLENPAAARDAKILVSSDARGEGMFISEVALRDKRPGHIVQRASKVFSKSSWSGEDYKAKFEDDQEAAEFLRKSGVQFLLVDTSLPKAAKKKHHELLSLAVEKNPEHFRLLGEYPIERAGKRIPGAIHVYQVAE